MPVSDFFREDIRTPASEVPSAAECERMLAAFLRVTDAEARARILDVMRRYARN